MARMFQSCSFLGISLLTLISTGCVSADKYAATKMDRDQKSEQLSAAQSQINSTMAQNDVFRQQMERIRNSGDNQAALLVNQAATIAELTHQRDDYAEKYRMAIDSVGKAGSSPISPILTNELTAFAAQNPDLVDFDSAKGLVKFKSDVTFSAGSAELQSPAKSAIDRFAQILNSPAAAPYDLMIVGHTDSQPVSNPNTRKAGHFDNWYLSAHRAITVSHELRSKGVSSGRLEVAGFADQRPLDAAATKDGMARNRRVEVLIMPGTGHAAVAATPAPSAPTAIPAAAKVAPKAAPKVTNKDETTADTAEPRPYISK